MSVGHNAKTAAEAGLQPWLHGGGGGGGEAACVRLSIKKSSIRAARAQRGRRVFDNFQRHLHLSFGPPAVIDAPQTLSAGETHETKTIPQSGDEQ